MEELTESLVDMTSLNLERERVMVRYREERVTTRAALRDLLYVVDEIRTKGLDPRSDRANDAIMGGWKLLGEGEGKE